MARLNLTVFQTCRLLGIDPFDYLRDVPPLHHHRQNHRSPGRDPARLPDASQRCSHCLITDEFSCKKIGTRISVHQFSAEISITPLPRLAHTASAMGYIVFSTRVWDGIAEWVPDMGHRIRISLELIDQRLRYGPRPTCRILVLWRSETSQPPRRNDTP